MSDAAEPLQARTAVRGADDRAAAELARSRACLRRPRRSSGARAGGVIEMPPGGRRRLWGRSAFRPGPLTRGDERRQRRVPLFSLPPGSYLSLAVPGSPRHLQDTSSGRQVRGDLLPGNAERSRSVCGLAGSRRRGSIEFAAPTVRRHRCGTVLDPAGAIVERVRASYLLPDAGRCRARARAGRRERHARTDVSIAGVAPRTDSVHGAPGVECRRAASRYARMPLTIDRDMDVAVHLRSSATVQGMAISKAENGQRRAYQRPLSLRRRRGFDGRAGPDHSRPDVHARTSDRHDVVRTSAARWYLSTVMMDRKTYRHANRVPRRRYAPVTVTLSRRLASSGTVLSKSEWSESRVVLFSAERHWHDRTPPRKRGPNYANS